MKKILLLLGVCMFGFSVASYAFWGQKKEENVIKSAPVSVAMQIEKVEEIKKPVENKRVIRFKDLVKLLLNEEVAKQLELTEKQTQEIKEVQKDLKVSLKSVKVFYNKQTKEIRSEYSEKLKPFKQELRKTSAAIKTEKVTDLNSVLDKKQQKKLGNILDNPKK